MQNVSLAPNVSISEGEKTETRTQNLKIGQAVVLWHEGNSVYVQ